MRSEVLKFKPWKVRASSDIRLGEQSPVFLLVTALLGPSYARFILRLDRISIEGREILVEEYRRAVADEGRFIIAYRHPGDADPHLVFHALTNLLRGEAPATAADGRPGAWYPSGSEVQLWATPLVNWALRNAGIVPIQHGSVARATLDYLVKAVAERRRPMAIAPEGMATFHQDLVSEFDAGTARIAALAADKLGASGRTVPVRIVPIAIEYDFERTTSPERLSRFVRRLERRILPGDEGLPRLGSADREPNALRSRLLAVWEGLVAIAELHFARAWGIKPAAAGTGLRERALTLIDSSIGRLEAYYSVEPSASLKARILVIRAESLHRVFYSKDEIARLSPVERAAAERGAAESYFLDQVYLLAGLLVHLDPAYIDGDPLFDRLVETAVNLDDFANRLGGRGIGQRSRYFMKDARIIVGEPIEAGHREGEKLRESSDRVTEELDSAFRRLVR